MLLFLLLVILVGLCLHWRSSSRHPHNFPPGPRTPLPVIGDLLSLGMDFTRGMEGLLERYGSIVGFWVGSQRTVILSDPDDIMECMATDDLSDRPPIPESETRRGGPAKDSGMPGVIFINGQSWVEQRRFALRTLRDFGLGKSGMEAMVAEEVEDLCERIGREGTGETGMLMKNFFNKSALRALWKVLTSEDLEVTQPTLPALWDRMAKVFEFNNSSLIWVAIQHPIVSPILELLGVETFGILDDKFSEIINGVIRTHEEAYQEDSQLDFTDVYMKRMRDSASVPSSSFHGRHGERNLHYSLNDLMQAGTITTGATMGWATLFMAKNPEVQERVQRELDLTVGRNRLPTWGDRTGTPYTEAVLHEIQRMSDLVPIGLPHMSRRDAKIGGYDLPKGTQVFPMLGMVMKNPKLFPNPERFDPGRFLSEDGRRFEPSPYVVPFGVGRRRCLGEGLARMELYRFFTGMLHRFSVRRHPDDGLDHVVGTLATLNAPSQYRVMFVPRT